MAVNIRRGTIEDMVQIQNANLWCLPENYQFKYYAYHYIMWPNLLHVAEDSKGRIVGYVLAKMGDEAESKEPKHGHITSVAVMRSHRKMGIATRLMRASHRDMQECFGAKYVSLHVRAGNKAGRHMYEQTLGYTMHEVEKRYYADGENAHCMRLYFIPPTTAASATSGSGASTVMTDKKDTEKTLQSEGASLRCSFCQKLEDSEKPLRLCQACGTTRYCGVECQKQDWPTHKAVCKMVQEQKKAKAGGTAKGTTASVNGTSA